MRKRWTALGATVTAMAGCGFHTPPALSVADLRLGEVGDEHAVVTLVIEATNSESEPMPLGATTYELRINGETAFRGEWDAQATAPVAGAVRFELPAVVDAALLREGERAEYAVRGTVEYVPPGALGEALFNARVRTGSAGFGERGELVVGATGGP